MAILSLILLSLLSFLLIIVVLLQRGRGGGLAGAFGGMGGQSAFGTRAGDVFTRITVVLAIIWVVLAGVSGMALRAASENAAGLNLNKKDDVGMKAAEDPANDNLPKADPLPVNDKDKKGPFDLGDDKKDDATKDDSNKSDADKKEKPADDVKKDAEKKPEDPKESKKEESKKADSSDKKTSEEPKKEK